MTANKLRKLVGEYWALGIHSDAFESTLGTTASGLRACAGPADHPPALFLARPEFLGVRVRVTVEQIPFREIKYFSARVEAIDRPRGRVGVVRSTESDGLLMEWVPVGHDSLIKAAEAFHSKRSVSIVRLDEGPWTVADLIPPQLYGQP